MAVILKSYPKFEYKIFDSNKRKFTYSGTIEAYKPMGKALHCAWLNDDEVLIAGGAGFSNQAYIFKDRKLEKIQNLKNGYVKPKILPYKGQYPDIWRRRQWVDN